MLQKTIGLGSFVCDKYRQYFPIGIQSFNLNKEKRRMVYNSSGKYRKVFVTSFNTSAMEALNIQDLVDCDVARYVCMSMEHAPTTGRIHYHLYIEFYSQKTMNTIKKILKDATANIHPARSRGLRQEGRCHVERSRHYVQPRSPLRP